jgi:hypothetical protein
MTAPLHAFPTANGRYYAHPARKSSVPSITNIKDIKNIPALKYHFSRVAATYAADNSQMLAGLPRDAAFTLIKESPFQKSDDDPGRIGDIVHDWIDRYAKSNGQPPGTDELAAVPITARRMWTQFEAFRDRYNPEFVDSEFTVWSETHGYAGTADLFMKMNGAGILADTKTGKNVYPEVAMQLAALDKADFILDPEGRELPMHHADAYACLHLRPTYFELRPIDNIEAAWRAFLGLKEVFDWNVNYSDKTLGFAPRVGSRYDERQAA